MLRKTSSLTLWAVLMFPDASDEYWESFLTQVPQEELDLGVPVEDMTHEPLGLSLIHI